MSACLEWEDMVYNVSSTVPAYHKYMIFDAHLGAYLDGKPASLWDICHLTRKVPGDEVEEWKRRKRPTIFCFWNTRYHGFKKLVIVQAVISADSSHFSHPTASTTNMSTCLEWEDMVYNVSLIVPACHKYMIFNAYLGTYLDGKLTNLWDLPFD